MEELIPVFMANRGKDLDRLRASLEAGDYDAVRFTGHGLKGLGSTYGFNAISIIGGLLEDAALAENDEEIAHLVSELGDYLNRVTVNYE
jgi:HPt (histidine-containing phosphotransfer) domain-containing protein